VPDWPARLHENLTEAWYGGLRAVRRSTGEWWLGVAMKRRPFVLAVACCAAALLMGATPARAVARPDTHTHPLIGAHPAAGVGPITGLSAGGGTSRFTGTTTTSLNWAGYDDSTDGPFTGVTATWVQPAIRFAGATAFTDAAFWVGLDGDNSDTVEQIGTEGYSEGAVGYDAWYEMYPAAPVTIGMSIHAGDVMTASVAESGVATFTLTLVDQTTGKSFTTVQTMSVPPALASAEVIAEAPSSDSDVVPLGRFGLVRFTDCAFNGQPIGDFNWNQIDIVSYADRTVAATRALDPDGAGFLVATDLTPPATRVSGAAPLWHHLPATLHFTATDNAGGTGVAYTEYSLDGGTTWATGDSVVVPAPADHSGDGPHDVLYRSADQAGNVEAARTARVSIDTDPPTPVADWPAHVRRGRVAALRYRIDDPRPGSPTATVTIRIFTSHDRLAKKITLVGQGVDRALACDFACHLARGRYRFVVSATDAAGNRQTATAANTLVVR